MDVTARPATVDDLEHLGALYRGLAEEQAALKKMWPLADGLPEPIDAALKDLVADDDAIVVVGEIDGYPFGFAYATSETLLPQAGGRRVGTIRLIYTDFEARGVGVGEAMIKAVLAALRASGHTLFDARVSPGHRNAKNFFEANGFSARLIVMHHEDDGG